MWVSSGYGIDAAMCVWLQAFHRELLSKEGLVEDIRKKAQELLKTRRGVPGEEALQQQLQELGMLIERRLCADGVHHSCVL